MANSDASGLDIGPALPPGMRRAKEQDISTAGLPEPSRVEDSDVPIGPALPPHLRRTQNLDQTSSSFVSIKDEDSRRPVSDCNIGPALPPEMRGDDVKRTDGSSGHSVGSDEEEDAGYIGPALPPHLIGTHNPNVMNEKALAAASTSSLEDQNSGKKEGDCDHGEEDEEDTYGPTLPPGFLTRQTSDEKPTNTIGPALPPGFQTQTAEEESGDSDSEQDEDSGDESSEEEVIGPMLPTEQDYLHAQRRSAADELEARAAAMKNKLTRKDEDVAPSRDSWMTELPEFSKNFGLGPRTFRKNARPDDADRSGWTDTPADRARKHQERMEKAAAEMRSSFSVSKEERRKKKKERREEKMSKRDERMAKMVAKHNETARPESLMEIHAKNRKRKLEEEGSQRQERRPFDRETDLQVSRFDDARRKQLLKKSAHLGDKFAHSSEKMYL